VTTAKRLGFREWQRFQEQRVGDGENARIRTNAEAKVRIATSAKPEF
jgi:hypothetical protein